VANRPPLEHEEEEVHEDGYGGARRATITVQVQVGVPAWQWRHGLGEAGFGGVWLFIV
jgi:hypothetical protein